MNLSTQLRAILLIAGMALLGVIYFWGRRKQGATSRPPIALDSGNYPQRDPSLGHSLEHGLNHGVDHGVDHGLDRSFNDDHDASPVMYDYDEPVHAQPAPAADRVELTAHAEDATPPAWDDLPPIYAERQQATFTEPTVPAFGDAMPLLHEPIPRESNRGESTVNESTVNESTEAWPRDESRDEFDVPADAVEPARVESGRVEPRVTMVPATPELAPAVQIPTIDESLATAPHRARQPSPVTSRVTPTLSEPVRVEPSSQPVRAAAQPAKPNSRKIVALRVALAGERVSGEWLLQWFAAHRLQHGKFNIFHRLHDGRIVFSVASMVEPGSFDLTTMKEQQFPGVTLFALLPGPVDGVHAFEQLLECGQQLSQAMNAVLQDERGTKLTPHAIERLRDEVLDFQHLLGGVPTS